MSKYLDTQTNFNDKNLYINVYTIYKSKVQSLYSETS